jgi:hypothetical protein
VSGSQLAGHTSSCGVPSTAHIWDLSQAEDGDEEDVREDEEADQG